MKEPLCLETDAASVGLGTWLLKGREGINIPHDETPDNTALCLITFASKSLSCAGTMYSDIEREVLSTLHSLKKLLKLILCPRSHSYHWLQTIGSQLQKNI